MKKKKFNYAELSKILKNNKITEIMIIENNEVIIERLIITKGQYLLKKTSSKKYYNLSNRDFNNLINQINKQFKKHKKVLDLNNNNYEFLSTTRYICLLNKNIVENRSIIIRKFKTISMDADTFHANANKHLLYAIKKSLTIE